MDDTTLATVADALASARREGRALADVPAAWLPADLAEAYRLQRAVVAKLGGVRGWKVSALTAEAQRAAQVPGVIAAPLLAPWFEASPTELSLAQWPAWVKLECEFAFEIARDLPPRPDTPYERTEVEAAIGALRIGIEVCASRVPSGLSTLLELGDALNNGAYVAGPARADWRGIDYASHEIILSARDGGGQRELARGTGRAILGGDPVGAVVLMTNALAPDPQRGLRAGQIVTTGTCTGALPVDLAMKRPLELVADFGALGRLELTLQP
jgi:2-keto-4-pentenoate hydratase